MHIKWILLALLHGSLIVSQHDSEEACKGRAAILHDRDHVVSTKCVDVFDPESQTQTQTGWFVDSNCAMSIGTITTR